MMTYSCWGVAYVLAGLVELVFIKTNKLGTLNRKLRKNFVFVAKQGSRACFTNQYLTLIVTRKNFNQKISDTRLRNPRRRCKPSFCSPKFVYKVDDSRP